MVEPSRPVSLKVVVGEVPTCRKLLQVAPAQRSIKYWVMVPPVAVKVGAAVVAEAVLEYGPVVLVESMARTR